jgi:hypothetical protein
VGGDRLSRRRRAQIAFLVDLVGGSLQLEGSFVDSVDVERIHVVRLLSRGR